MKVKRYLVKDMNEAMIKIKSDLGMDAIILNTRKIKSGGLFRFFKKPMIEVVAAIDEANPEPTRPNRRTAPIPNKNIEPEKSHQSNHIKSEIPEKSTINTGESDRTEIHLNSDINELKEMVGLLIRKVEIIEKDDSHNLPLSPKEKYIQYLIELGIQESISKKIIEIVERQINMDDKNHDTIINAIKVIAKEYIGDVLPIESDLPIKPNIYLFLGPTGVGKTTTLAKIAARLTLIENKRVGLITADTYRIAAVEQLKTYSEILGIPLEVIYESSELESAIEKFKDKDYILIDTAGRSHKSVELKNDYDELVKYIDRVKVFLVLSMTTGFRDMMSIIESYHFLDDYRILFTKLDEAVSYGNILNIKVLTGKPLSYFAIGQSVPDDIEVAEKERILNYIFNN